MMRALTLSELREPLNACLLGDDHSISAVTTDSRSVHEGSLFVALKGERFDGHDFVGSVEAAGASGAVVSQPQTTTLAQLEVVDTQQALGQIGAYNRALFEHPVVAITGSNGKTTAKNMTRAVLSQVGSTLATEGNFNNEIGVPLTLLRLTPDHQFAVVEMGAARKGDIAWLCKLGRPTIALLLNAMPAHLEGFGSVEEVANAKGEIFDGLTRDSVAIINADQPWADQWRQRAAPAQVLDFSLQGTAAIYATDIRDRGLEGVSFIAHTPQGELPLDLALPGRHNVSNALAAIAVGIACDVPASAIRQGLESATAAGGRLNVINTVDGLCIIDDCYNANPGSVRAAIDLLAASEGRRCLLLGAMRELGSDSVDLHADVGRYARAKHIDTLWAVGEETIPVVQAFGDGARHFDSLESAAAAARDAFGSGDVVLIKGSRGAHMEVVLAALQLPHRQEIG